MSEYSEQVALMEWCLLYETRFPDLKNLFAIPNGGKRHVVVAMKLKQEGVRSGVPDLCLACARLGYHGLYIEMKFEGNHLTDHQQEWAQRLKDAGYDFAVCYSAKEACIKICNYLGIYFKLDPWEGVIIP